MSTEKSQNRKSKTREAMLQTGLRIDWMIMELWVQVHTKICLPTVTNIMVMVTRTWPLIFFKINPIRCFHFLSSSLPQVFTVYWRVRQSSVNKYFLFNFWFSFDVGLALGLQSDIPTAIHLFIGIILHECLVSVALALNAVRLQQQNINLLMHIKFALLFSLTIPLGNVLGILLGYTPGHFGRFISAIFQGFAAGTFIHVTFFGLIPEEFLFSSDCDMQEDELIKRMTNNQENSERNSHLEPSEANDSIHSIAPSTLNLEHNDTHNHLLKSSNSNNTHNIKLRKILLLIIGFILMAIIPLFLENNS